MYSIHMNTSVYIYSFLLEISLGVVLLVSAAFYVNVFIMYSVCTYVTCT